MEGYKTGKTGKPGRTGKILVSEGSQTPIDYYSDDYLALKNLFNDMYAKDISKKVRSSLIVKKQNGEFVGKLAPYGYIKDPKDKHKFLIDKNVFNNSSGSNT